MISSPHQNLWGLDSTRRASRPRKERCTMTCARSRSLFAVLFVFFCLAFLLQAQVDTGTILGTVTDATGAVIPGAKVTIRNEGTSFTQSTTTSASGTYVFTPLRIGTDTVEVAKERFNRRRRAGL